MMKIGSSVDCKEWWHEKCSSYEGSEHLYATTAKFSGCVLLDSRPASYSYTPRRTDEIGNASFCLQNPIGGTGTPDRETCSTEMFNGDNSRQV
ncbi:hypothetical protein AVEN_6109-1 [Araneus ventricosus]|uniref:Uncharacterized protein n=1 Tax=Araneus ventricosus TaxID=182803 RepID=A0A4Y2KN78_ARAVE|nr:hypothetical protein AVEN_6109-1 [Araneus ventricosus]